MVFAYSTVYCTPRPHCNFLSYHAAAQKVAYVSSFTRFKADFFTETAHWYRSKLFFLILMSLAMVCAFSAWTALLNNFVVEHANFNGSDIGWLQAVREIPGFLSFLVIFVIIFIKEQKLAILSLVALGLGTAITSEFPTFYGLLITTFIGSLGFHYYETVKQSLELQWIAKHRAAETLGWLIAFSNLASLMVYLLIILFWEIFNFDYPTLYWFFGGLTLLISAYLWVGFPQFQSPIRQKTQIILKSRYWLYYVLQFMAGARRQIFLVFAAFMMVERFGFEVHQVTALFLLNFLANIILAPLFGRFVAVYGERAALCLEYTGLFIVFMLYAGIYTFHWGVVFAATLYVVDHFFFALALAQKTYFQKIADPEDIAPTAAVAFTINHIGAVFLPALLGYIWIIAPEAVFYFAAFLAALSFMLSLLIPRHPVKGKETILKFYKT